MKLDVSFLVNAKEFLNSLKEPARLEAAELFPHHPKAQEIWIKLRSSGGGVEPVVKVLGLQDDYLEYSNQFNKYYEAGNTEAAILSIEDFRKFCMQQLRENFYLFK